MALLSKKAAYEFQEFPKWVDDASGKRVLVQTAEEEAEVSGPAKLVQETADAQIKRLAEFLSAKIPEEVQDDESAVDCAIRLLGMAVEDAPAAGAASAVEVGNSLTTVSRRGPGRPPKSAEPDKA